MSIGLCTREKVSLERDCLRLVALSLTSLDLIIKVKSLFFLKIFVKERLALGVSNKKKSLVFFLSIDSFSSIKKA